MFTLLAYSSFFIDQNVPPARVTLCITNVLNSIAILVKVESYVPSVPYANWMSEFLLYNLVFTIIPLIEYGVVNSCTVIFNQQNAKIANTLTDMKNMIIKEMAKEEEITAMATQEVQDTN